MLISFYYGIKGILATIYLHWFPVLKESQRKKVVGFQ